MEQQFNNIENSEVRVSEVETCEVESNEIEVNIDESLLATINSKDKKFIIKIYNQYKYYFENVKNVYINDNVLINNLVKIHNNISTSSINRCLECGIDMGEHNPRQLCGKTHCSYY